METANIASLENAHISARQFCCEAGLTVGVCNTLGKKKHIEILNVAMGYLLKIWAMTASFPGRAGSSDDTI